MNGDWTSPGMQKGSSPAVRRRLAAILVADIAGYSRLMSADEEAALLEMQKFRFSLVDPTIGQHHGRIIKTMGDGLLVEFGSVHDAIECSLAVQRGMVDRMRGVPDNSRFRYRMGINLCDVLSEGGDVYGDGVNIAARLQEIAEPNGIAISSVVLGHLEDELQHAFADMGAHELKNITRPVRVYHYRADAHEKPENVAIRPFIDPPDNKPMLITGGCLCGKVRYQATTKPLGSMLCHCRMCQRFSGAPILGGTTFPAEALSFTQGEPKYFVSSKIAQRGFCGDCGTALIYQGTLGVWTKWSMIFTASLDEPEKYPPTYHLGIESTMPWLDIHDDLPRTMCKNSPSLVDAYRTVNEEVP